MAIDMKKILLTALITAGSMLSCHAAFSETLMGALAKAYNNNTTLNFDRAGVRIIDEDIAIAKSGYRPTINGFAGYSRGQSATTRYYSTVGSIGIQLDQKIFDGFVTRNSVAAAEMQAQAQREFLRNSEQNQLLAAVEAYSDVYTARRIAILRRQNLAALEEQVRADRARLEVGAGTRTDLAQSEAQRSQAISQLHQAQADVKSKEAVYRQVVGVEADSLAVPVGPRNLPAGKDQGIQIALAEHPAILSSRYAVDAASYVVKTREGALLPQVGVTASTSYNELYNGPGRGGRSDSVGVQMDVPIYQGGRTSAQIRQSKEQLTQAQIQVDLNEDRVRQSLLSSWAQLEGAKSAMIAYKDSVRASQIALDGLVEENRVGEATTLDVLISRTMLIDSQINLVIAERDVVVAGYAVKVALGRLSAASLGLQVVTYDPLEHYNAVRNKWIGTKTPDGR
ncbi:MAG: TolC family type I secretion outer membrane protein [Candidatus Tokpelaia hoelldobleri]|uniref:TolC family type I secretion outer membrane protein n=1 Tax=Candidatus Tokpelaia hoelldobleri TaxID=1902579 RepID=A0A1U9JTQ1_9HYPH|nr:MAG: TolC family type I secretion outer membrane protein [Candidatus Tokpelaia hoelldoblerii]